MAEVKLERLVPLAPTRVYQAWTQPDLLARWFAPGDMGITVHTADARVGGGFSITMHGEEDHTCVGTYQQVSPQRLQMTFNWTGEALPEDSILVVTIEAEGDGARVSLEHSNLPSPESATNHADGWQGCLEKLANLKL